MKHLDRFRPLQAALCGWLLLAWALLGAAPLRAQVPVWQQLIYNRNQTTEVGTSDARATATDAAGNVYVLGSFSGVLTFGSTVLRSTNSGTADDLFLAKWNTATSSWAWAIGEGGSNDDAGLALAVQGADLYVAGTCGAGATIAGTALTVTGGTDGFVAKYTDNGSSVTGRWAVNAGGGTTDYANGVAVNGSSVYLVGGFTYRATIAGVALSSASSTTDMFVAKYTDNGSTVANGWALAGGSGQGADYATAVAVSGANVYVGGMFYGSASIAGTTIVSTNMAGSGFTSPSQDAFLARYTDAGTTGTGAWAVRGGGQGNDLVYALAASGNSVYAAGTFVNTATFGSLTLTANSSSADAFVVKYTDTGSTAAPVWGLRDGGTGVEIARALLVRGTDLYLAGTFTGTASLAGTTLAPAATTTAGSTDAFVARYTETATGATGTWAAGGGGPGSDGAYGVAVGPAGVSVALSSGNNSAFFGARRTLIPIAGALGLADNATGAWQPLITPVRGGTASIEASVADAAGNIIVTGGFRGQVVLGRHLLTCGNDLAARDVFVAKYSPALNDWVWAVSTGGPGDDMGTSIGLNGNTLYVGGTFAGSNVPLAGSVLTSTGYADVFVAKFVDNGATVSEGWAVGGGGTNVDVLANLAVSGNSIYLAGTYSSFAGSAALVGMPMPTPAGITDIYLAKLTDNGSTATGNWVTTAGGSDYDYVEDLAVSGNRLYLTGACNSPTTRIAGTTFPSSARGNVYLAKYLDNGATVSDGWAISFGGPGADNGQALAVAGNNVYVAGSSSQAFTLAGTTLGTATNSLFLAKFTDAGTPPAAVWARADGAYVDARRLLVDGNRLFVAGQIGSTPVSIAGVPLTPTGSRDAFVARYTDAGATVSGDWATSGGSTADDYGYALAVSGPQVYLGGSMAYPSTFGSFTTANGSVTNFGYYMSRLTEGLTTVVTGTAAPARAELRLYPNPARGSFTVRTAAGTGPATAVLFNALGQAVRQVALPTAETVVPTHGLPAGLYHLRVLAPGGATTRAVVLD